MKQTPITEDELWKYNWNYLNGCDNGMMTNDIWLEFRFNIDYIDGVMNFKSNFEGEPLYRKLSHIDTMEKLKEFWKVFSDEELKKVR